MSESHCNTPTVLCHSHGLHWKCHAATSDPKRPFYYAMMTSESGMPVCEFLTTRHRNRWLSSTADFFVEDAVKVNGNRRICPQVSYRYTWFVLLL